MLAKRVCWQAHIHRIDLTSSSFPDSWPSDLQLPFLGWTVTGPGLRAAAYLTMRAETAATFSILVALCTPWNNVLKALRVLRLPTVVVVFWA